MVAAVVKLVLWIPTGRRRDAAPRWRAVPASSARRTLAATWRHGQREGDLAIQLAHADVLLVAGVRDLLERCPPARLDVGRTSWDLSSEADAAAVRLLVLAAAAVATQDVQVHGSAVRRPRGRAGPC